MTNGVIINSLLGERTNQTIERPPTDLTVYTFLSSGIDPSRHRSRYELITIDVTHTDSYPTLYVRYVDGENPTLLDRKRVTKIYMEKLIVKNIRDETKTSKIT